MKNITIAGNCTKDAVMRETQGGSKVASFSIAVNGFANGEKTTTYFDVSMWGKRGQAILQFAKKGAKMCVTGDLSKREYDGKTYLDVNASDFTPMGGGSSGDNSGGYQEPQGGGYDNYTSKISTDATSDMDDEIPF